MSTTVEQILKSFDLLPNIEKQHLMKELLLRTSDIDFGPISDDELTMIAEEQFLELDAQEAKNADAQSR